MSLSVRFLAFKMSDLILKICGAAILSAIFILILKKSGSDSVPLLKIAAVILLCGTCVMAFSPIIEYMRSLSDAVGSLLSVSAISVLLKALCVAFLTYICASVCRECGEGGIAYFVELAGKGEIILLSLELIGEIFKVAEKILDLGI